MGVSSIAAMISCLSSKNCLGRSGDDSFQLRRRNSPTVSRLARTSLNEAARNIVPIAPLALDRVRRGQAFTALVEQLADERARRRAGRAHLEMRPMLAQESSSLVPVRALYDGRVCTWVADPFVANLADIDRVAQQRVERATRE